MAEPKRVSDISALVPELAFAVGRIVSDMEAEGHPVRVIETARSLERQEWLYAKGRTSPGPIVTRAKPGSSKHTPNERGQARACDLCFAGDSPFGDHHPWHRIGELSARYGLRWSGSMGDFGHVEIP